MPPAPDFLMGHFWLDRPTLVTGATGLVGGWIVQRLMEQGAATVCIVRDWAQHSRLLSELTTDRVTLVRADVCEQTSLERVIGEYEIDTVLHLAAQTIVEVANRNPISTFQTNVGGTWTLLEACRRSPTVRQIVVASSDKAYGDHGHAAYDEESPLRGRHPYDVSKACADLIAQSYAASFKLPVTVTRCGNFYGGGDLNWSRLIPGAIRSIYRGNPPVIRSNGLYARDYLYVEDGADAYLLLAERLAADESLRGQSFNFSSGGQLTVLEVVSRISDLMGSRIPPEIRDNATNEIPVQRLSTTKARDALGWQPRFTFDQGLHRTVSWYTEFLKRQDALSRAG